MLLAVCWCCVLLLSWIKTVKKMGMKVRDLLPINSQRVWKHLIPHFNEVREILASIHTRKNPWSQWLSVISFHIFGSVLMMIEYFVGSGPGFPLVAKWFTIYMVKVCNVKSPFRLRIVFLTHWGLVTHICVSKLTTIASDNGLSPSRGQAISWTNAGILLIRTLGTRFSEIISEIHIILVKKMHLKMSSAI